MKAFKSSFYREPGLTHLNNAGLSLLPIAAARTLSEWSERLARRGLHDSADLFASIERVRALLAQLVGCSLEELALFSCTAAALSQAAEASGVGPGDEILLWEQEYPSSLYPWRAHAERVGAKLKVMPNEPSLSAPVEKLVKNIGPRVRAISLSWVQFQTGAFADLKALTSVTRDKGIFVTVDVIQGLGVLPFDFAGSGVDAACGGSQKWLCGPMGLGFLALRKEHVARTRPIASGAFSYGTSEDLASLDRPLRSDARRFEPGTQPVLQLAAFAESLELILKTGPAEISKEALRLTKLARAQLESLGYATIAPHGTSQLSTILTVCHGPHAPTRTIESMEQRLAAAKISCAKRGGGIRISPHAYNEDQDIDRLAEALS